MSAEKKKRKKENFRHYLLNERFDHHRWCCMLILFAKLNNVENPLGMAQALRGICEADFMFIDSK